MGKSSAPPPPDFTGAANQMGQQSQGNVSAQTQNNRPNQTNAFGFGSQWNQAPNGQWSQSSTAGGPLGSAAQGLENQFQQNNASPMDNGSSVFGQAQTAGYNQATSRLDPRMQQAQTSLDSQLANQGLDPNSQAYRNAEQQFGQQRNDAYQSAFNNATTNAGQLQAQTFGENLAARNNPMQQLQGLQGLSQQQGFNAAGQAQGGNLLGAAQDQGQYAIDATKMNNQNTADMINGLGRFGGSVAGGVASTLSDERMKHEIQRHPVEAHPGVPFASFKYKHGPQDRHLGVIAQDVEKVQPDAVKHDSNGVKHVDYSKLKAFSFKG